MIKINNELKQLIEQWNNDFKGDLMESIEQDIENGATLKESIQIITNECFPIWIEESEGDTETIDLYKQYQNKFKEIYNSLEV